MGGHITPGDNLYTSSTIAIDAATGKTVGYHQYDPNESFDWDEVSPPLLIDFKRNGKTIKGLIDVARDGYMFFLERTSGGPIQFVDANPYVLQTELARDMAHNGKPKLKDIDRTVVKLHEV